MTFSVLCVLLFNRSVKLKKIAAESLLAAGADPRICRSGDAYGVESALYYALCAKNWKMAEKLYDAGDRLDDLVVEPRSPSGISPEVKTELLEAVERRFNHCPAVLHPGWEPITRIVALIDRAANTGEPR